MEKTYLTTTVHRVGVVDGKPCCEICKAEIPQLKKKRPNSRSEWQPGEYVGIIVGHISNSKTVYRIGSHNQELLCNGTHASEFFQESDGSHEEEGK